MSQLFKQKKVFKKRNYLKCEQIVELWDMVGLEVTISDAAKKMNLSRECAKEWIHELRDCIYHGRRVRRSIGRQELIDAVRIIKLRPDYQKSAVRAMEINTATVEKEPEPGDGFIIAFERYIHHVVRNEVRMYMAQTQTAAKSK